MPELNTERITKHTLVLTEDELASLREAARLALIDSVPSIHTKTWQQFVVLGKGATRATKGDTTANGSQRIHLDSLVINESRPGF